MAKKVKEVVSDEGLENSPEVVVEAPKAKAPKVERFSNNDFYEFLIQLKAEVDKEMNLRKSEKSVNGEKLESAAQLTGLSMGLTAVTQRFKIFAKPSKAF